MRAVSTVQLSSQERILQVAREEFAEHGFRGARLADIASRAGLSHPTLLYHFNSKEDLYAAVIAAAVADWAHDTEAAASAGLSGFAQVEAILDAGFGFLATHRDFVRIVRREALDGGGRLEEMLSEHARPFVDRAVVFLEREMEAGRLRSHDPLELIQVYYGAVFTYFSDAGFRERLIGEDPLSEAALARHRRALTELLRPALEPSAAGSTTQSGTASGRFPHGRSPRRG
jgi:TetR/AcrR family transcriptional regulator